MPTLDCAHLPFLLYGGDYNPDQWPRDVWREDVALMREAGVNFVSLGIFSWSKLEPRPGDFDFAWLDDVMDMLHAGGIAVDLATATASPPAWLAKQYPESLPVTSTGVRLAFGARQGYSPHSQAYREHAARLVERMADRYKGHPALAMWHVNNEYGCHVSECFSDAGAAAFRLWLQRKYGTLDALNHAWGTSFWSQIRYSWDEVDPPRAAPTFVNPAMQLDWKRFSSDAILELMHMEVAILRRVTPDVPITTNFMGFFKPLDYFKWAEGEDLVSEDAYPDPSSADEPAHNAMRFDLMRSFKRGVPWLLMEQAPSAVNWRPRNSPKRPGQMRAFSLQAVARGARGVMFFQWRQSAAGSEKFHSALVPHAGRDTRVWREVSALGADLAKLGDIREAPVRADAAIVFSWENWWAMELDSHPTADLKMLGQLRAYYDRLYEQNLTVDFVQPGQDLAGYKLVCVPNLYLTRLEAVAALERFVAQGGVAVVSPFSGIVDENDRVHLGGYPAPLRALLGVRIEEFAPLQPGEGNRVATRDEELFTSRVWSDVMECTTAQPVAMFTEDYVTQRPAVTRNAFGAGYAYYLGTCLDADGMRWVLARARHDAGLVSPMATPAGVEAVWRGDWLFVLNHTRDAQRVALPAGLRDALSGAPASALADLGPNESRVFRRP